MPVTTAVQATSDDASPPTNSDLASEARRYRWGTILFIGVITLATLVGCPIYVWKNSLTISELAFFLFYAVASSFSITLGYHRLFSHAAFQASWPVRLFVLIFGGAAFEQSAMRWAALHRLHHRYTDTQRDPYNIKRGFFYAHVGWVLLRIPRVDYSIVRDLARDPLVLHQHKHYKLWSHFWGLIVPLLIGALIGGWTYAILFPVAARIFLVLNSAFIVNSVAHTYGDQPFDSGSSARDHWLGILLANGDGYHNFHHCFPRDYRHGIRWYDWDPTKWLIWLLAKVGLASHLTTIPAVSISRARLDG